MDGSKCKETISYGILIKLGHTENIDNPSIIIAWFCISSENRMLLGGSGSSSQSGNSLSLPTALTARRHLDTKKKSDTRLAILTRLAIIPSTCHSHLPPPVCLPINFSLFSRILYYPHWCFIILDSSLLIHIQSCKTKTRLPSYSMAIEY